jgi:hypothetical protein
MQQEDRRAAGVQRVPVEKIVEICGREPGIPAFEAESIELSGRGMHVRTPYLPELSAPLVCRLEDDGREVVVEGVVAWRNETESGGEFGVSFTALDSRGVDVLRSLCGIDGDGDAPEAEASEGDAESPAPMTTTVRGAEMAPEPSPEPPLAMPGSPVKLHIDGLGSPMKARVRRGSRRRVHVGSNLEFLKVGRNLQVEDLGSSNRLAAYIDSVDVSIDPQTDVPQLVVTLRYEGVEPGTPSPSVVDAQVAPRQEAPAPRAEMKAVKPEPPKAAAPAKPASDLDEELDDEDDELLDEDFDRFVQQGQMRERLAEFGAAAEKAAKTTGALVARVSATTATTMGRFAKQAGERVGQKMADVRKARAGARRTQRSAGAAAPSPMSKGQRLRPQSGLRSQSRRGTPAVDPNARRKKIALASAGLGVVLAGSVVALSGGNDGTAEKASTEAAETAAAQPSPSVVEPPAMKVTAAEPAAKKGPPKNDQGIVADVPLFGATPMATMEPAPLEPPPDDIEEQSDVPDQTFDGPSGDGKKATVWGHGRLHLPFVHRIKLDEPGKSLEGAKRPTGFTVFLPGRKLLETGKTIQRRDDRIVEVRTGNEPRGARVTFVFQGKVPAYKARLKGQNVEFFISSPEGK